MDATRGIELRHIPHSKLCNGQWTVSAHLEGTVYVLLALLPTMLPLSPS